MWQHGAAVSSYRLMIGLATSSENLAELCCTTTIWTVDLAYLLQRFPVRCFYYTVTFGANPDYSDETCYRVIYLFPLCISVIILCQWLINDMTLSTLQEQLPTDMVRVDKSRLATAF
ncbi:hypothetical protein V6N11_057294 [Hibiscus sabdariffa]|uniref:Uncharacterized protein n=1 Tax=Hibiscus sabdariffa TaxID=183260 RepID=A0ABR2NKV5_9ROSI